MVIGRFEIEIFILVLSRCYECWTSNGKNSKGIEKVINYFFGVKMINGKSTLNAVFKEAKKRIDGLATIVLIILSVFVPILIAGLKAIRFGYFKFNWLGLTVPIIVFLIYIRFRQIATTESKFRQIFDSMLIVGISFSFIYAVNFKSGRS